MPRTVVTSRYIPSVTVPVTGADMEELREAALKSAEAYFGREDGFEFEILTFSARANVLDVEGRPVRFAASVTVNRVPVQEED